MIKFPYDEFAKDFLETLLSPFGKVDPAYKIAAEVREVDVYFIGSENYYSTRGSGFNYAVITFVFGTNSSG
jgi:hypothetical protein